MRKVAMLALLVALLAPATAWAGAGDLTVTRSKQLDPRLLELGFTTKALPTETNVRVLLPDGYDAQPNRRWPVLYLLHGCCDFDVDGSQAWTIHGEAEKLTAGMPLIVVMPAGGRGGMYSNWVAPGLDGHKPQWETYHVDELIPWVDANFRTKAERGSRAIAGLSMGGFGAMKYAATYPNRFGFAASFSGVVDSNTDGGTIHALLPNLDGGTPASVWGLRATNEARWRSQNPWDLAENLRGMRLELRTGNGVGIPPDPIESIAERNSISLHKRLDALHIPHVWDDYGPGTHTWPFWTRDLKATLPAILETFAASPATVAPVHCDGRRATMVGTGRSDELRGTKRRDVIAALGGNDVVRGLGGNDVICGGAGRDTLLGGPGNDLLLGGSGNDRIRGGAGRDRLRGGPGRDEQVP